MCRVQLYGSGVTGAESFVSDAFPDWKGSLFLTKERDEQGERAITIFASREGHELPLAPR